MTAALATLNQAAMVTLADCELRIERGLKTFIDVGQALAEIRDSRLYKGTHETFDAYLEQRWQMSRSYAHRMIAAAEVVLPIGNTGLPSPTNEGQARALAAVPEPERADVWRETVERTNGKPTAAAVRTIHEERTQTPGPVDKPSPVDPGVTPAPAVESPALAAPREPDQPAVTPPPGSPATWTPEQHEQNRLEIQRVQIVERAQRRAPRLVAEIRGLINEVLGAINLGETGLVTPEMVAEIRAVIDILEARMEAQQ